MVWYFYKECFYVKSVFKYGLCRAAVTAGIYAEYMYICWLASDAVTNKFVHFYTTLCVLKTSLKSKVLMVEKHAKLCFVFLTQRHRIYQPINKVSGERLWAIAQQETGKKMI